MLVAVHLVGLCAKFVNSKHAVIEIWTALHLHTIYSKARSLTFAKSSASPDVGLQCNYRDVRISTFKFSHDALVVQFLRGHTKNSAVQQS